MNGVARVDEIRRLRIAVHQAGARQIGEQPDQHPNVLVGEPLAQVDAADVAHHQIGIASKRSEAPLDQCDRLKRRNTEHPQPMRVLPRALRPRGPPHASDRVRPRLDVVPLHDECLAFDVQPRHRRGVTGLDDEAALELRVDVFDHRRHRAFERRAITDQISVKAPFRMKLAAIAQHLAQVVTHARAPRAMHRSDEFAAVGIDGLVAARHRIRVPRRDEPRLRADLELGEEQRQVAHAGVWRQRFVVAHAADAAAVHQIEPMVGAQYVAEVQIVLNHAVCVQARQHRHGLRQIRLVGGRRVFEKLEQ